MVFVRGRMADSAPTHLARQGFLTGGLSEGSLKLQEHPC